MTASAVYYALKALLDPEIPPNAGAWRPIRIVAPEGTVVHARPPAPVGGETSSSLSASWTQSLAP